VVETDLRCSVWTAAQDVDPVGSAGRHDVIVLVETRGVWPADVGTLPGIAAAMAADPDALVLSVVPAPERTGSGGVGVTVWRRRSSSTLAGEDFLLADDGWADDLPALVSGDDVPPGVQRLGAAPPEVLVCGHGKRDRCCGNFGVRLATSVEDRWPGVRVRRVSHLGGHRYAPTALTLPDGRLWAFLDTEVLDRALAGTVDAADLALCHRGSTAFDPWQQAVEGALWARFGRSWLDAEVLDASTERRPDGTAEVRLRWAGPAGDGEARAVVEVARRLPVPVCGAPIEDAVKTSREYRVRELALR
jgi:hypothetical protein